MAKTIFKITIYLCFIFVVQNSINNYNLIDESLLDDYLENNYNPVLSDQDFSDQELLTINSFKYPKQEFLGTKDKGLKMTYSEKVMQAGYKFEEHKVVTDDGYILSLWRIPGKLNEMKNPGMPVILQHGLLDDSWTWLALNITDCLPIMLVEKNFDVWLSNSRGNIFSNSHINPDYDPSKFRNVYWNFTWNEMARYDLPAVTSYVKQLTGYQKINWIGHSQGTFQFFLSHAINPKFMEESFNKFVAIGTVVTIFNIVNFSNF
jgi:hypothetical protein